MFENLFDLISNKTNGILTDDDYPYVMKRIYFEAQIENVFFRKQSEFESYTLSDDKVECNNIPVFSFRYKNTFCKSEEKEFKNTLNKTAVYAQLCSQISAFLKSKSVDPNVLSEL